MELNSKKSSPGAIIKASPSKVVGAERLDYLQAMDALKGILTDLGSSMDSVVKTTIFMTNISVCHPPLSVHSFANM